MCTFLAPSKRQLFSIFSYLSFFLSFSTRSIFRRQEQNFASPVFRGRAFRIGICVWASAKCRWREDAKTRNQRRVPRSMVDLILQANMKLDRGSRGCRFGSGRIRIKKKLGMLNICTNNFLRQQFLPLTRLTYHLSFSKNLEFFVCLQIIRYDETDMIRSILNYIDAQPCRVLCVIL